MLALISSVGDAILMSFFISYKLGMYCRDFGLTKLETRNLQEISNTKGSAELCRGKLNAGGEKLTHV